MIENREVVRVKSIDVSIENINSEKYISLTDIARKKNYKEPRFVVINWLRNRNTIEFLGIWERIHNPNFNRVGFDTVKMQAGLNSFTLSPLKWITSINSIGIISKSGRYNSGTYAHEDIALEFASWISAEFKLYFIKEFRKLKYQEFERNDLDWNLRRQLSKINYKIHTDAIKDNLVPKEISKEEASKIYATEADLINKALFGKTAKEWKYLNKKVNIRENANINQLLVLLNLESLNSDLINNKLTQEKRIIRLNKAAIYQMKSLIGYENIKQLK